MHIAMLRKSSILLSNQFIFCTHCGNAIPRLFWITCENSTALSVSNAVLCAPIASPFTCTRHTDVLMTLQYHRLTTKPIAIMRQAQLLHDAAPPLPRDLPRPGYAQQRAPVHRYHPLHSHRKAKTLTRAPVRAYTPPKVGHKITGHITKISLERGNISLSMNFVAVESNVLEASTRPLRREQKRARWTLSRARPIS